MSILLDASHFTVRCYREQEVSVRPTVDTKQFIRWCLTQ